MLVPLVANLKHSRRERIAQMNRPTGKTTIELRISAVAVISLVAIACRVLPYVLSEFGMPIDPEGTVYPWNFSPILPLCLFGAACFASRLSAFAMPIGIFLLGDLSIWLVTGKVEWAFYAGQPLLYLSLLLVVALGLPLRGHRTWRRVAASGLGGGVAFFIASNFAVWAFGGGERYALSLAGLIDCYWQAIPFFRNTMISMLVFLPILFSPLMLRDFKRPAWSAGHA